MAVWSYHSSGSKLENLQEEKAAKLIGLLWQLRSSSNRFSERKGGILPSLGATKQHFSVCVGGSERRAASEVRGQPFSKDQEQMCYQTGVTEERPV